MPISRRRLVWLWMLIGGGVGAVFLACLPELRAGPEGQPPASVRRRPSVPWTQANGGPQSSGSEQGCRAAAKSAELPMVIVPVTVTNIWNQIATGLSKENFQVFEDGKEQRVACLERDESPASVGILLDTSESMGRLDPAAREAVRRLLGNDPVRGEFFLIGFAREPLLVSGFTKVPADIDVVSFRVRSRRGSALLDAVFLGLQQFEKAEFTKRVLLILTDGGDNGSRHSESEIREMLKRNEVQFHAVGLYHSVDSRQRSADELYGPSTLAELAKMTGGRSFVVENSKQLVDAIDALKLAIQNQYFLGYWPTNALGDGKWRKIKITARSLPKGSNSLVHTRAGYYAVQK